MKKVIIILGIVLVMIGIILVIYPFIEFKNDGYLYIMTYAKEEYNSKDYQELESGQSCYDESYFYNKKRNLSITSWEYKGFWFFKYHKLGYKEGNLCDNEFVLEESYIKRFINEAEIQEGSDNVDLAKLINGKKAIIQNKRYPWSDDASYIAYKLDGKFEEMFVHTNEDGILIIQVGNSDEGPKYIAYK